MFSHAPVLRARYIARQLFSFAVASTAFGTAGRVYMAPIDIYWPMIVDRIIHQVGAVSAGNIRVGIYREGAAADSPAGAALVVESASVAQSPANQIQMVTIAETLLIPGQYFVGLQGDDVTGTFWTSSTGIAGIGSYYDRGGGYGAFTDPCPAITATTVIPFMMLRVAQNLPAGGRTMEI